MRAPPASSDVGSCSLRPSSISPYRTAYESRSRKSKAPLQYNTVSQAFQWTKKSYPYAAEQGSQDIGGTCGRAKDELMTLMTTGCLDAIVLILNHRQYRLSTDMVLTNANCSLTL